MHDGKSSLRKTYLERRLAIPSDEADKAAAAIIAPAMEWLRTNEATCVAGYLPIRNELSPLPLMEALAMKGIKTALPVTPKIGDMLIFREWKSGEPLQPGAYGIGVPLSQAKEAVPDTLIVPLLAFDKRGHRLGYGGGFYDLTIKALRARNPKLRTIGLAFAAQEAGTLPIHDGDQLLDAVVTERGIWMKDER